MFECNNVVQKCIGVIQDLCILKVLLCHGIDRGVASEGMLRQRI